MRFNRSNLSKYIAGSYALITSATIFLSFKSPQSLLLNVAVIILTVPWSIGVVLLGFLLIHLSSHGMDYGFIFGAVLNTFLILILGKGLARKKIQ